MMKWSLALDRIGKVRRSSAGPPFPTAATPASSCVPCCCFQCEQSLAAASVPEAVFLEPTLPARTPRGTPFYDVGPLYMSEFADSARLRLMGQLLRTALLLAQVLLIGDACSSFADRRCLFLS